MAGNGVAGSGVAAMGCEPGGIYLGSGEGEGEGVAGGLPVLTVSEITDSLVTIVLGLTDWLMTSPTPTADDVALSVRATTRPADSNIAIASASA
jgi:hypothetical protein